LLIYRIRASHIGLVQLQDKIVVRFALTIYPYSLKMDGSSSYAGKLGFASILVRLRRIKTKILS